MEKETAVLVAMAMLMLAPMVSAGSVHRTISASSVGAGDQVSVTLNVSADDPGVSFAMEEDYPDGWIMIDAWETTMSRACSR